MHVRLQVLDSWISAILVAAKFPQPPHHGFPRFMYSEICMQTDEKGSAEFVLYSGSEVMKATPCKYTADSKLLAAGRQQVLWTGGADELPRPDAIRGDYRSWNPIPPLTLSAIASLQCCPFSTLISTLIQHMFARGPEAQQTGHLLLESA